MEWPTEPSLGSAVSTSVSGTVRKIGKLAELLSVQHAFSMKCQLPMLARSEACTHSTALLDVNKANGL